ncbi:MAG: squalene/phytoene synthase family protein [Rhodospirillales bacterium]|nr:squalene/phytoene synthase family protein [Rhodospirillales bacterium]
MPLSYCADLMRRYDNDRFLCAVFAPADEREGLMAVYAFNLEVARIRETVREPLLGHIRLRWWADTLDAIDAGGQPTHPVAGPLAEAMRRFGIERRRLDRILRARAFDLDASAPETVGDLIEYADATSAEPAAAGLQVLGVTDEETRAAAREVGIAWALVGLLRALPFNLGGGHLYLPQELTRQAGLDVEALLNRASSDPASLDRAGREGVARVVARIAESADDHLRRARDRRAGIDARGLPVLLPATLADLYLRRLRRSGFDPFDRRVQAPAPARIIWTSLARARGRF